MESKKTKLAIISGSAISLILFSGMAFLVLNKGDYIYAESNRGGFQQISNNESSDANSSNSEYPSRCFLNPSRKEAKSFKYNYISQDKEETYYLSIYSNGDPGEFLPNVYVGENCQLWRGSIMNPWSDALPEEVALVLKTEWYRFFSKESPKLFTHMTTDPWEVNAPFYPEDVEALESLGLSLGKKIRVFKDRDEYQEYQAENDPYFIKDHPSLKKNRR